MSLPACVLNRVGGKATAACDKIPFTEAVKSHVIFHLPFRMVIKVTQLNSTGSKWLMALELFR